MTSTRNSSEQTNIAKSSTDKSIDADVSTGASVDVNTGVDTGLRTRSRFRIKRGWRLTIGGVAAVSLTLLYITSHKLPSLDDRPHSVGLSASEAADTRFGRALATPMAQHPGFSGVTPLANAQNAFAARVLLARNAERTLDVQYYIWRNDLTGTLLLNELYQAAERGVRVRLLLDDHGTNKLDEIFAALNAHPNIEIRLFNPFAFRTFKLANFLTDFSRLNRRMHNKTFTADSQATIVGGRNIGDEYFAAGDGFLFADLDVLAVGAVVPEVTHDFDRYWASESSYPVTELLPDADPQVIERLVRNSQTLSQREDAQQYIQAILESDTVNAILAGQLPFYWSHVTMYSDDPRKGLGKAPKEKLLTTRLHEIMGNSRHQMDLVSPYFVPTQTGTDALVDLAQTGTDIRILTNSLRATDVTAVHAAYSKHRHALLEAGIRLFEMKPQDYNTPEEKLNPLGSSASSLHAKTFSVDGKRVFVGSFNFDPRSVDLNTELGFIIDTSGIAQQVRETFDRIMPLYAYEVKLDNDGELYWQERQPNGTHIQYDREPGMSPLKRLWVEFLKILPIEWLL